MRIQQDQRDTSSQSSKGFGGATRSPAILKVPFILPRMLLLAAATGASCATALRCLVMTTGCRVRATSSMIRRHSALNLVAEMVFGGIILVRLS